MLRKTLWLAVALLALVAPAWAQGGSSDVTRESVEVAPFGGLRTGGGFTAQLGDATRSFGLASDTSYGGIVDINLHKDNFKVELLYSRQKTRVDQEDALGLGASLPIDVEYLMAGMLQETGSPKGRFFVAGLIGATRFSPDGYDSATKFSVAVGGGVKLFLGRHVGLRLDARGHMTFVGGNGGTFCRNGGCVFAYSGSTLWQGDFTGGLILAF